MKTTRSRRTADKLAVYRAAATKAKTVNDVSVRVSPRRKNATNESASTELSPKKTTHDKVSGRRKGIWKSDSPSPKKSKQAMTRKSPSDQDSGMKGFDTLEVIPETPPRCQPRTVSRGRNKRVLPPRPSSFCSDSDDDSEKPSKKRKIFTTPPRVSEKEDESRPQIVGSPIQSPASQVNERSGLESGAESEVPETDEEDCPNDGTGISGMPLMSARRTSHRLGDVGLQPNCNLLQGISVPRRPGRTQANHAERSAMEIDDLNLLSLSSATLSRMMESFAKKVVSEMEHIQNKTVNEMRKMTEGVLSAVAGEIHHIEGVFSMMTRGMGGVRASKSGKKTTLTEWEEKLNALTPDTEIIFNKEVIGMLLCYNTPIQAATVYRKQEGSDLQKAVLSAQTLLFSIQPGDKKFAHSGKIGGLHSDFRFIVVQNAFFNVLRDTFNMFRDSDSPKNLKDSSISDSATSVGMVNNSERSSDILKQIKRPSWLKEKVTKDHINDARSFLERPNQSRKGKVRTTPSPYDVACHGALRVYRLLGSYLHVRRGAVRTSFFQSLGYILVPWYPSVTDVDQSTLSMSWGCQDGMNGGQDLSLNLSEVPCTDQVGFVTDHSSVTSADAKNKTLLQQIFKDWPGMVLTVEHTVYVVKGNGVQRKHSGGKPLKIRRLFNLIDAACDFCVEFCGAGDRETFLRAHKYSLRCVMIFALLFKALCVQVMDTVSDMSSAAPTDSEKSDTFPNPSDILVEGFCLKELIPGPTTRKNLLESRCLRMTQSEYNMYNYGGDGDPHATLGDGDERQVLDMMDIEESEELGIGVL